MPLDASERQILTDLVGALRTLARQMLTLHLQLGAMRAILARKGVVSEAELAAALAELDAMSWAQEVLSPDTPSVDEFFADLLRRLERPD